MSTNLKSGKVSEFDLAKTVRELCENVFKVSEFSENLQILLKSRILPMTKCLRSRKCRRPVENLKFD